MLGLAPRTGTAWGLRHLGEEAGEAAAGSSERRRRGPAKAEGLPGHPAARSKQTQARRARGARVRGGMAGLSASPLRAGPGGSYVTTFCKCTLRRGDVAGLDSGPGAGIARLSRGFLHGVEGQSHGVGICQGTVWKSQGRCGQALLWGCFCHQGFHPWVGPESPVTRVSPRRCPRGGVPVREAGQEGALAGHQWGAAGSVHGGGGQRAGAHHPLR